MATMVKARIRPSQKHRAAHRQIGIGNCLGAFRSVALLLAGCLLAGLAAPADAGTATLEPAALAEVRAEAPERTFETANLWINGNPSQARQLLLVFDLNELDADLDAVRFTDATLTLTKAASAGHIGWKYRAHFTGITDNADWDGRTPAPHGGEADSTIHWNNAPKNDTANNGVVEAGTTNLGAARLRDDKQTVNLADYLNWAVGRNAGFGDADRDEDGRLSVWLHASDPVVYRYHGEGEHGPTLNVTYTAGEQATGEAPATQAQAAAQPQIQAQQVATAPVETAAASAEAARTEASSRAPAPAGTMLNVQTDFGAIGDGEADDTEAIQQAFGSGKRVFLPRGVYRVTEPIKARARTHVQGAGGMWNPQRQTVIRYDGPEGGTVLHVQQAFNFKMEDVHIDGAKKAGIGVYWLYSTNEAGLTDVAIRNTRDHALFVTRTWYAYFTRVVCRDNLGAGITISRDAHDGLSKGPVNYVHFNQCRGSHSGENGEYDGRENVATGYGFGSFGYNSMINVSQCAFEQNGGPGIYIEGSASTMRFEGNYIEYNSQGVIEREPDGWRSKPDRPSLGRVANIILDTKTREAVVFDTNYLHPVGGIWLRGEPGGRNPILFQRTLHPQVIWAEHDDWAFESRWQPKTADEPGVFYKKEDGKYAWKPASSVE